MIPKRRRGGRRLKLLNEVYENAISHNWEFQTIQFDLFERRSIRISQVSHFIPRFQHSL